MTFERATYKKLNSRQKENYNFHQLAAVLVEYGYTTIMRLTDDWRGADLIAQHKDGKRELRIQLKSRLTFAKKYRAKGVWIAFPDSDREQWFVYPHDNLLPKFGFKRTKSWTKGGGYSSNYVSSNNRKLLERYALWRGSRKVSNKDE